MSYRSGGSPTLEKSKLDADFCGTPKEKKSRQGYPEKFDDGRLDLYEESYSFFD